MTGRLEWTIEEVSEAAGTTSGSMEFECQGDDADVCFPVGVDFVSQKGICGVDVSLPLFVSSILEESRGTDESSSFFVCVLSLSL